MLFFENESDVSVLNQIQNHYSIASIHFNMDLTPFAKKRDGEIEKWCKDMKIPCLKLEDYTFHSIHEVRTKTDSFYQGFSFSKSQL